MGRASRRKRERRAEGRRGPSGPSPRPDTSPVGQRGWISLSGRRTRVFALDGQWDDLDDQVAWLLDLDCESAVPPLVSPLGNVLDDLASTRSLCDVAAAVARCEVPERIAALSRGPFAARAILAAARADEGLQLLRGSGLSEVRRMRGVPPAAHVFAPWRAISGMGLANVIRRARRAGIPTPVGPALGLCALYLATPGLGVVVEADRGDDDHPISLPDPLVLAGLAEPVVVPPRSLAGEADLAAQLSLASERASILASPMRTGGFYDLGGRVEAVVLVGDERNELTDTVLWIVRPDRDPSGLTRMQQEQRRVLLGRLDRAELAPVARALARLVAQPELWEVSDRV